MISVAYASIFSLDGFADTDELVEPLLLVAEQQRRVGSRSGEIEPASPIIHSLDPVQFGG